MTIEIVTGTDLTYYLISYDKNGAERTDDPDAPNGRLSEVVLDVLQREPITDVCFTSHGVRIEDRINGNPDFDQIGHIGYSAIEDGCDSGWRGCPLGRSRSKDGAILDLLNRANSESGTSYKVADLVIIDESVGPEVYAVQKAAQSLSNKDGAKLVERVLSYEVASEIGDNALRNLRSLLSCDFKPSTR